MKGTAARLRDGIFVGAFLTVFCLVLMLMVSRAAVAEVRNTVSTPNADQYQYGGGDRLNGNASDTAIAASQAFQEPDSGSADGDSSPSSDNSSADASDGSIETSPVSEKEGYVGEAAREAGITELPDTGGASPASLLGGVLVAGGFLVRLARKVS